METQSYTPLYLYPFLSFSSSISLPNLSFLGSPKRGSGAALGSPRAASITQQVQGKVGGTLLRDSDRTHLQQHGRPCVGDAGQEKHPGQHQSESQRSSRASLCHLALSLRRVILRARNQESTADELSRLSSPRQVHVHWTAHPEFPESPEFGTIYGRGTKLKINLNFTVLNFHIIFDLSDLTDSTLEIFRALTGTPAFKNPQNRTLGAFLGAFMSQQVEVGVGESQDKWASCGDG